MEPSEHDRREGPLPAPALTSTAREQVIEVLSHHYAHDVISQAELEARLDRVFQARTRAELDMLVADLPGATGESNEGQVAVAPPHPRVVSAFFSAQEQRIMGTVPRRLQLRARMGYVEVDLTRATFQPGETTIDVRVFMGYVQVRLPAGVRVDNDGRAIFGYFSHKGSQSPEADDGARVVRITGRAVFGFAESYTASAVTEESAGELPPPGNPAD